MKNEEKEVKTTEETKKEVKVEEDGEKLTDEEMSSVAAGWDQGGLFPVGES